jgi:signal peptidase I
MAVDKTVAPRRWDPIVFRYPDDRRQSYVKRLVGLPGERIDMHGGDLFADGRRLTKPPGEHQGMWLLVHDSSYEPRQPVHDDPRGFARPVNPRADESAEAPEDESTDGNADPRPGPLETLVYWGPLNADIPYNMGRLEPGPIPAVHDLKLQCMVSRLPDGAPLEMVWRIPGGGVVARFELGRCTLIEIATDEREGATVVEELSQPIAGGTVTAMLRDGRLYALQRDRVVARMDVLPERLLDARQRAGEESGEDSLLDPELKIRTGPGVELGRIRLWRDIHYLRLDEMPNLGAYQPEDRLPMELGPDEYFALGDNVLRAKDGRFWGPVPAGDVIGVARWIYWPPDRMNDLRR